MAGMSFLFRAGVFLVGLLTIWQGKSQLIAGHWVFKNASYHQTTFAAGVMGSGFVLCALAFLPTSAWMYRHITTGRKSKTRQKQPFS
jgi:hypothetical protein